MNVVALLAHPDDELMCAGTLAKFVDDDADVTIVTAFSDHRSPELHQSAKTLGVRLIERYAAQLDFTWNQATKTLSVGKREGSFEGMLAKRVFNMVLLNEKNGLGIESSQSAKVVGYDGRSIQIGF